MKKIYSLLICLVLASYSFAQVKQQTVTRSSVVFHIKNLGLTIDGKFTGFKGDIKFDPTNLPGSSVSATVDVNTLDTDNGTRNDHLKSDSYFDAAKFPSITMKSTALRHKSGNNYSGTFSLTIKDVTKTIEIPFSYVETGNTAEFKGNFQIERTDYGVGGKSLVMSNDVKVDLDVTTSK